MFTDILWRFLILETFVMKALCTNCSNDHPQKQFCTSEYVLKVKILKKINLPVGYAYRTVIKRLFKGNFLALNIQSRRYVNVETPSYLNFLTGTKHFIFGRNKNGNIYTDKCKGNKPAVIGIRFFRRGLSRLYRKGCDCLNKIPRYNERMKCYWNYSYMKRFGENCDWVRTRDYNRCPKETVLGPIMEYHIPNQPQ